MSPALLMAAAIGLPLLAALLIPLAHGNKNLREGITLVAALLTLGVVIKLLNGPVPGPQAILTMPIPGAPIAFRVEPLGAIFALVASLLWIVASFFSIGYMRGNNEPRQTRFYACFAIAIASAIGVSFADNLLTLFLFYEILSLSTYPLVTHHMNPEAIRSGRKYLGILMGTSIGLFFLAMLATWVIADTVDFKAGGILAGKASPAVGSILLLLFMYGVGKAALMPMHKWLPAAMVAPTPVSALLHAVAVVKAGVFAVVKIAVYIFGTDYLKTLWGADMVLVIAGFTIIAASIVALRQDNLKLRLAYSTISQLSYVVLAAMILAPLSTLGAALHVAAHAVGKITLFMAAGSIYTAGHKTLVSQLDGIGRRMPWTMTAFTVGALSMIGVPPAIGFLSKWYMLLGAFDVANIFAILIIIASTLLNAAYFLPVIYGAFLKPEPAGAPEHGEAPWPIVLALMLTSGFTIGLFLYPEVVLGFARAVGTISGSQ